MPAAEPPDPVGKTRGILPRVFLCLPWGNTPCWWVIEPNVGNGAVAV